MHRYLILAALTVSACETVVDIDPPPYRSQLVTTSYFTPDSTWSARVTQSLAIGAVQDPNADFFLESAKVTIWRGDVLVDELIPNPNGRPEWYVSSTGSRPEAGRSYRIVVEAPGLGTATAESYVPPRPRLSEVTLEHTRDENEFGEHEYTFRFTLSDTPEADYYNFSAFLAHTAVEGQITTNYSIWALIMNHTDPAWQCSYSDALNPVTINELGDDVGCYQGIMSDRLFQNASRDFDLTVRYTPLYDFGQSNLLLYVNALTPEYVEYQHTLEEQDDFFSFGEPLNLYTNFENGLGIFAGYSGSWRLFALADLE